MVSRQISRADRRSISVVVAQELFSPASISVAHTISWPPLDLSMAGMIFVALDPVALVAGAGAGAGSGG
jgi:hypothetical protein